MLGTHPEAWSSCSVVGLSSLVCWCKLPNQCWHQVSEFGEKINPPPQKKNISCRILFQRGDLDIKLQHKKSTFFLWFPQRVQVIHGFNFCGIVTCLIGQSHCLMGTLDLWWASFGKPWRSIVKSGDEFRKNYGYRMDTGNSEWIRSQSGLSTVQQIYKLWLL